MQKIGEALVLEEYDIDVVVIVIVLTVSFKSVDKLHLHVFRVSPTPQGRRSEF